MKKLSSSEKESLVEEEEEYDDDVNEQSQFMASSLQNDTAAAQHQSTWKAALCFNWAPCLPARYILVIMGFVGLSLDYALRINLSIAIIGMQGFDWSEEQEGWILSSFFYGYALTQVMGGYLASRFGGRHVLGTGLLMASILTLFTPLAARLHLSVLMVLRILEGIFEGVTLPAMHALWGKWAPPKERSLLTAITYSGAFFGHVVGFFVAAVICEYAGGWPSIFYILGGGGIVWYVFWLYLGFSSPETHPRISKKEREYIETSIEEDHRHHCKSKKVPWLYIFLSPAVWAIVVAHFSFNWGMYTLMTCVPSYFKDILELSNRNIVENGLLSSIPYIVYVVVASISGQVSDILREYCCSTVVVRKVFNTFGLCFAIVGLLGMAYISGSSEIAAVIFLTLSVGFSGMTATGFYINHIDIAPQYAGILFGISNTIATIPGMLTPVIAKSITIKPRPDQDYLAVYREEWQEVFLIAAEVYAFGAIIFIILGKGERQWWAGGPSQDNKTTTAHHEGSADGKSAAASHDMESGGMESDKNNNAPIELKKTNKNNTVE